MRFHFNQYFVKLNETKKKFLLFIIEKYYMQLECIKRQTNNLICEFKILKLNLYEIT